MPRPKQTDETPRSPLYRLRTEVAQVTAKNMAMALGVDLLKYTGWESGDVPFTETFMKKLDEFMGPGKGRDLERQHKDFREARLAELQRVIKERLGGSR